MSDTIDTGDLTLWFRFPNYKGHDPDSEDGYIHGSRSPFGVWGALGSMNGGETSTL